MLHVSPYVFVRPKRISRTLSLGMNYGLSLNDFYVYNGEKLGNFHAHPIVDRYQALRFVEKSWGSTFCLDGFATGSHPRGRS
jgi:hypothetical protein